MCELTYAESVLLSNEMGNFICCVERAQKVINKLIQDYFSDIEQKAIASYDAEFIGNILRFLENSLTQNLVEYTCKAGGFGLAAHTTQWEIKENKQLLTFCELVCEADRLREEIFKQHDSGKDAALKSLMDVPLNDEVIDKMRQIVNQETTQRGAEADGND